jgi:hypothetical protein
MKYGIQTLSVVSCVFAVGSISLHAEESRAVPVPQEVVVKDPYEVIALRLDVSRRPLSVDDLVQMGTSIERLPVAEKTAFTERALQRRFKLELWLKAINELDRMLDPAFSPADVPRLNVTLPGVAMDSGADPGTITDPRIREQYEQAIKANADKADRYRAQTRLRKINDNWSAGLGAYIKSQYTSSTQDVEEIRHCIDTYLLDSSRKEQMNKALVVTP